MQICATEFRRSAKILLILALFAMSNSVKINLSNNYIVEFDLINGNQSIRFKVQAINVTGWIGIGVNDKSHSCMLGADMFIGGYNSSNNSPYGADYHVAKVGKNVEPVLDEKQNWTLMYAKHEKGNTDMAIQRLLKLTNKTEDLEIMNKAMYLVWAYNNISDYDKDKNHTKSGILQVNLITGEVSSGYIISGYGNIVIFIWSISLTNLLSGWLLCTK